MNERDEKKLESLSNRIIRLMDKLHKSQKLLTQLKEEADTLLRKVLKIDGDKK